MLFESVRRRVCAVIFSYLLLSQHALAYRTAVSRKNIQTAASASNQSSDAVGPALKMCNPFSRQHEVKHYRFDVSLKPPKQGKQYCHHGTCMAIEMIRDKNAPLLKVYRGQHWAVRLQKRRRTWRKTTTTTTLTATPSPDTILDKKTKFRWSLMNHGRYEPRELDLKAVSRIVFQWGEDNTDGRDRLAIIGRDGKIDLVLQGGIYMSHKILQHGIENANWKVVEDLVDARHAHIEGSGGRGVVAAHGKKGAKKGVAILGVSTALSTGLFYGNSLMLAYASGTLAMVTNYAVLMAGVIALGALMSGVVAGLLVGATIGAVVGISKKRKYKKMASKSAPTKLFEKLRCMGNIYKSCHHGLELVPGEPFRWNGVDHNASCPEEPFHWDVARKIKHGQYAK